MCITNMCLQMWVHTIMSCSLAYRNMHDRLLSHQPALVVPQGAWGSPSHTWSRLVLVLQNQIDNLQHTHTQTRMSYFLYLMSGTREFILFFNCIVYATPLYKHLSLHVSTILKKIRSPVGNCFPGSYFLLFQIEKVITRYTSTQMPQPIS